MVLLGPQSRFGGTAQAITSRHSDDASYERGHDRAGPLRAARLRLVPIPSGTPSAATVDSDTPGTAAELPQYIEGISLSEYGRCDPRVYADVRSPFYEWAEYLRV